MNMKKIFIWIISIFFLTGCSNISNKNLINLDDRKNLEVLIFEIKSELDNGSVERLKSVLDPSLKNIFISNEIEKVDFSQIKIFINKPKFFKNSAESMIAFIVEDRTIYFDVHFSLKNGEWKIIEFKERR